MMEYFGFGEEVATLTVSLFIAGYCLGPLVWGPLSEDVCCLSPFPIFNSRSNPPPDRSSPGFFNFMLFLYGMVYPRPHSSEF